MALPSCRKDDEEIPPAPVNEAEVITTLRLTFHSATDTVVLAFEDLDGAGGNAPVITGDTFLLNGNYSCTLLLLNASVSPVDTISNEVAAEAEEHQFFFSTTDNSLIWSGYADVDGNGMPLGLLTNWNTGGAPGQGMVDVVLRHMPDKSASGVSAGDITNAGGETDIEVSLPFVVQ